MSVMTKEEQELYMPLKQKFEKANHLLWKIRTKLDVFTDNDILHLNEEDVCPVKELKELRGSTPSPSGPVVLYELAGMAFQCTDVKADKVYETPTQTVEKRNVTPVFYSNTWYKTPDDAIACWSSGVWSPNGYLVTLDQYKAKNSWSSLEEAKTYIYERRLNLEHKYRKRFEKVKQLQQQYQHKMESYTRMIRRRIEEEKLKARKKAIDDFLESLGPMRDRLEWRQEGFLAEDKVKLITDGFAMRSIIEESPCGKDPLELSTDWCGTIHSTRKVRAELRMVKRLNSCQAVCVKNDCPYINDCKYAKLSIYRWSSRNTRARNVDVLEEMKIMEQARTARLGVA